MADTGAGRFPHLPPATAPAEGSTVLVRAVIARCWPGGDVTVAIKRPHGTNYVRVSDTDLFPAELLPDGALTGG